jgi:hypothetical protein
MVPEAFSSPGPMRYRRNALPFDIVAMPANSAKGEADLPRNR